MDERKNSTYELRLRAVRAVRRGMPISEIADAYDTNRSTIYRWVKRFEKEGEVGLQRRPTSGRPRKLEDLTEEELRDIALQPASQFGYTNPTCGQEKVSGTDMVIWVVSSVGPSVAESTQGPAGGLSFSPTPHRRTDSHVECSV